MTTVAERELTVRLPAPHAKQAAFVDSTAKRNIVRAGRRGGKTVGVGVRAVQRFLAGRRQLYAAPTQEQIDRFWTEVTRRRRTDPRGGPPQDLSLRARPESA